jgi:transmembrane sensor
MTGPTRTSPDDSLLEEALDWVVRLKAGTPTLADVEALQLWRQQSEAHEQAFRTAARIYRHAGTAAKELADEQAACVVPAVQRPPRVLARRAVLAGGLAAAAAYAVVRPPLGLWPSVEELSADYRTGKGERRKVAIAPDVSLELNTQTSVALRSASNETRIELISGEAWVDAKTSSSKPLVVLASNGRITASQANFDARCLDGIVTVACLAGGLTVEQGGKIAQLGPKQQITYSDSGIQPQVAVDVGQVSAWQTGLLVFRDRPLSSVVDEINRYRSGKLIITSTALSHRLVNGTFQIDKLDNFVDQVEQLFGASITRLPGGVVLMS